ncbi:MAG: hypothetical protein EZS28_043078, partial [Streblomastix strix]
MNVLGNLRQQKLDKFPPQIDVNSAETLYLDGNSLKNVDFLSNFPSLWNIDLFGNQIESLEQMRFYEAFGLVDLSNNKITWEELLKLRHVSILDLRLSNNPNLPSYYRPIAIYLLPYVWAIDGWYISQYERLRASTWCSVGEGKDLYKQVRSISDHAPHAPTKRLLIETTHAHSLMINFAKEAPQSRLTDQRRLRFLTEFFTENARIQVGYNSQEQQQLISLQYPLQ